MRPPARIGEPLESVDTPALVLELDAFERNLRTLAEAVRGRGVRVRTHAKTHKCPEVAKRQMALGAVGASRVAPFAAVPFPRPWWHHDGGGPLRDLVRWVDLEGGPGGPAQSS